MQLAMVNRQMTSDKSETVINSCCSNVAGVYCFMSRRDKLLVEKMIQGISAP
jgi:hypothetical protein